MPRIPVLGYRVPNLSGLGLHGVTQLYNLPMKWTVICSSPVSQKDSSLHIRNTYRSLEPLDIEFLTIRSATHITSIYIVDPNRVVRAILHDSPQSPISPTNIASIISSLDESYRPVIQSIDNQPINPACADVRQIVGEYVLGDPQNVDPYLLDFVISAFGLIQPDGSIEVYSERFLQELANLRFVNPNLKVLLAIGGWGNDGFSDAALTPKSRFDFAREVQKWVNEYDLDGVDIDWEYPGTSAAGITSRPEDKENFTLLLEALRQVLGPDKWITVAGIGDNSYVNNVEIEAIGEIIDYFNLMSYDYTAGLSGPAGNKHHSNLFESERAVPGISTDIYVQNLIDAGMPPEKILLGVGYYGRQGMANTITFDEIRNRFLNKNGYTVKWDNVAKAPYIVDRFGNFVYSFDNELSIYFKAKYAEENCLGGLFGWQSNMDRANILLNAMQLGIRNPAELEEILSQQYLG